MAYRLSRPPARAVTALTCLAAAVVAVMPLPAAAGRAAAGGSPDKTMCRRYQHVTVRAARGARYVVKNDSFGARRLCLSVTGGWPNFAITHAWVGAHAKKPRAYPFILRGCSWGTCSPRSGLPRQVRALRRPEATWYTSQRAGGKWDAAFDLWFGRRPLVTGQARGAEVMIWLNAREAALPPRHRVVWLAGARWYFQHWRACHAGACWNYLQYRRVRPTTWVSHLPLLPFVAHAGAHRLIRGSWWLENIEAGFELWHGGRGLATRWFWARP